MGKRSHSRVNRHQGDVPDLKPAMVALELSHQVYGAVFEELLGETTVVFLVLLDGGEVFAAKLID